MIKFNLTSSELHNLKKACAAFKLPYEAQAARPRVARELIAKCYATLPQCISPGV